MQTPLSISEVLTLTVKLEELETKFATNENSKQSVLDLVNETRSLILPIRLQLNEFISLMANIDKMTETSNIDKYNHIRKSLLTLQNNIQTLSQNFVKLNPLFNTIPEYSTKHNSREFKPLESLSNDPFAKGSPRTTSSGSANNTITSATSITTNANNKISAATPSSNINTPASSSQNITNTTPSIKKPRKPRQPRKSITQTNTANKASKTTTPSAPTPVAAPMQTPGTMNPALPVQNFNTKTPINLGSPNGPQFSPPPQQGQINFNDITPANILNMNQSRSIPNNNNNANNEMFGNLDLSNLDLNNLNMDFI
ncbi:hypothetical protein KAFR_0I01000 [Kazachstania africana CBS 2517]|uniref:Uncharacterized protein n=1 Tax=Kazachstania africana (strain ATCC 22294 / BCRC 22015 / CBS 2517 / CECT 1963 / NBRC 1671 / NRRL Y-8276) TaxID=1071382 RepID=H2AZT1_KAZAF|nr:hypothetical protein KAFR_0I01000 [Kazachstania africana CBS 2517]CCF59881.1 hypothetical protein KAFR_0I01000 [Kazachstania africana CBS 2517]